MLQITKLVIVLLQIKNRKRGPLLMEDVTCTSNYLLL